MVGYTGFDTQFRVATYFDEAQGNSRLRSVGLSHRFAARPGQTKRLFLAVAFYQLQGMGTMMQFIVMQSQQGDKMDPAAVSQMISALTPIYAAGLLSVFAFVWMFVRIVRFWKNGVATNLSNTANNAEAYSIFVK